MMRCPEIEGFISISPPANTEDFSFLAPCPSSGLIVHGDADESIPVDTVSKLASKLGAQKNIEIEFTPIKGADHFYKNKIELLNKQICRYLDEALAPDKEVAKEKAPSKKKQ